MIRTGVAERFAFHLLDEFRDILQGKPRLEITEITGRDLERAAARRRRRGSPTRGAASR
jgi:hypothetical protein